MAKTETTSIIVPKGPSTLFPKIGRNVFEINAGSFFLNWKYAHANATTPYTAHAWKPHCINAPLKASL